MHKNESHRAALDARRDIVRAEIFAALARINDDRYAALLDQAHDTKDRAVAQLLLDSDDADLRRAAAELQDIDAALLRVSTGTYGKCTTCGVEIPAMRLSAYPTAKRCLPCQSGHESNRNTRS